MQGLPRVSVRQSRRICQSGPVYLLQQPALTVCLHSSSTMHRTLHKPTYAAKASLRKSVLVSNSAAGSNSSINIKRKKKTAAPNNGSSSSPAVSSASAVVAAATAAPATTVDTTTDSSAAISIANPPLGFSNNSSNMSNNIVSAAPLVVPPSTRNPADASSDEDLEVDGAATGASGSASQYRCLILDSRYLPVNVVSWFRAVVMDASGNVDVLEYHPGGYAYSAYKAHPLPAVLRVRTFVDVHEFAGKLSLTRKNIMMRDHNRCQYCGSTKELTLDHVTPVCRGGVNSWTNLVTACMACNQRKGDKSLAQMGWKLPRVPREPTPQELGVIAGINKGDIMNPPLPWLPYLATFKQVMEKAQRRAARELQQQQTGSYSSSSSSYSDAGSDLVTVTVHPAGPNSKASKAAAAVAAAGGGVKSKAGKKQR